MSTISFPFDLSAVVRTDGTTAVYTCPTGKRAWVTVSLSVSYVVSNYSDGPIKGYRHVTRIHNEILNPGESVQGVQSGADSSVNTTLTPSASYKKSGVTRETLSVSFNPDDAAETVYGEGSVSYTVLEFTY